MIMPLSEFPIAKQEEIARLVALDTPPPKWLGFRADGDSRPMVQIVSRAWYEWHLARRRKPRPDGTFRELSEGRRDWLKVARVLRPFILERDAYTCQQCGADRTTAKLHIDHVVALANGGSSDPENLQVLCQPCNQRKWAH